MDIKRHVIPFWVGGPIQDPVDFGGRREVLQKISNDMKRLQNVSLHGERRTGKTSLLLYLNHPNSSEMIGSSEAHIPVYFNFQGLAQTSAADVWRALADAIVEQIKQRHPSGQARSKRFLATIEKLSNYGWYYTS